MSTFQPNQTTLDSAYYTARERAVELQSQGYLPSDIYVFTIAEASAKAGYPLAEEHKEHMRTYLRLNELALCVDDVVVAIASYPNLARWTTLPHDTELPREVLARVASSKDSTFGLVVEYMKFISRTTTARQLMICSEVWRRVPELLHDQAACMRYVLDNYS